MTNNPLFLDLAAAFVRGTALRNETLILSEQLLREPLEALTEAEKQAIADVGTASGMKLYRFKQGHVEMPRVRRVIGFLQGVMPNSILDVGSGRGAFLWPCLDAFPDIPVAAVDLQEDHFELYGTVRLGGMPLSKSDGVGNGLRRVRDMLQDFEHRDDVEGLVGSIKCSNIGLMSRQGSDIVISVPSKEDDNPHHLHLLTEPILRDMLAGAGCTRVRFDYTLGHLLAVVTL